MNITYTCPICEAETEVEVTEGRPSKTFGRPEDCYPEEPDEFEPTECHSCESEIDSDTVWETTRDLICQAAEERAEMKADEARDRNFDDHYYY